MRILCELNNFLWLHSTKTILLTIEFIFHPPPFLLPSTTSPTPSEAPTPIRMLTHRNRLSDSLQTSIAAKLTELSKRKDNDKNKTKDRPLPEWLTDLLLPNPDDPAAFVPPVCALPTILDPLASLARPATHNNNHYAHPYAGAGNLRPGHITRAAFFKLAYDAPLATALAHAQFVEFPTVEVWERDAFRGTVVDARGRVVRGVEDDDDDEEDGEQGRKRKRRRTMSKKAGMEKIGGLVGGYGSGSGSGSEGEEEESVLGMLGGYAGSDEDDDEGDVQEPGGEGEEETEQNEIKDVPMEEAAAEDTTAMEDRQRAAFESQFDYELGDEDAEGETDDGEEVDFDDEAWDQEEGAPSGGGPPQQNAEALAVLLEQLRQAGALRGTGLSRVPVTDEDQVDWGDSADEDES